MIVPADPPQEKPYEDPDLPELADDVSGEDKENPAVRVQVQPGLKCANAA